jgi:hypothetical protein
VEAHSSLRYSVQERFYKTFEYLFAMMFGDAKDIVRAARTVSAAAAAAMHRASTRRVCQARSWPAGAAAAQWRQGPHARDAGTIQGGRRVHC